MTLDTIHEILWFCGKKSSKSTHIFAQNIYFLYSRKLRVIPYWYSAKYVYATLLNIFKLFLIGFLLYSVISDFIWLMKAWGLQKVSHIFSQYIKSTFLTKRFETEKSRIMFFNWWKCGSSELLCCCFFFWGGGGKINHYNIKPLQYNRTIVFGHILHTVQNYGVCSMIISQNKFLQPY